MKKVLGTAIFLFIALFVTAQNISVVVTGKNNLPLKGATITIISKSFKEKRN